MDEHTDSFSILDETGKSVRVVVEERGRICFEGMFDFYYDWGCVSYIEGDFEMHYAPDVCQSVRRVWTSFPDSKKPLLKEILVKAKESVQGWTIRDATDAKDQKTVLDICAKFGV